MKILQTWFSKLKLEERLPADAVVARVIAIREKAAFYSERAA